MAGVNDPCRAKSADNESSSKFISVASGHRRAKAFSISGIETFKA